MISGIKHQKLFFISLIGIVITSLILTTTYAYQSIKVNYEEQSKKELTLNAGVLDVSFAVTKDINLENMPLLKDYYTADYIEMTIDNTHSDEDAAYEIYLRNLEYSSSLATEDFRYTVIDVTNSTNHVLIGEGNFKDLTGEDYILNLSDRTYDYITKGTTKTIRLYLWLKETTSNQNHLENTSFKGNVEISSIYKSDVPTLPTIANTIINNYGGETAISQITSFTATEEGKSNLFKTTDDYGISYYLNGDVTNNYVKFGKWSSDPIKTYGYEFADISGSGYKTEEAATSACESSKTSWCDNAGMYCSESCNVYEVSSEIQPLAGQDMYWRIIRINGDNSLRLIYDGTSALANGTEREAYIDSVYFDSAGYMYGPDDDPFNNVNDSNLKKTLDYWYKNNLDVKYSDYISDTLFCNDRKGEFDSSGYIYYAAYYRSEYTLNCSQQNDRFTTDDIEIGNGDLKYPIGTITYDEFQLAGYMGGAATTNYLWTMYSSNENGTLTMTPAFYDGGLYMYADYDGMQAVDDYSSHIVRPVINLKDTANFIGLGTKDSPFEIKIN